MKNLKKIDGDLLENILRGSIIIWSGYDNKDHWVLVQNPSDSKWKFQEFQTTDEGCFILFSSYNYTKIKTIEKVKDEFYESKHLNNL